MVFPEADIKYALAQPGVTNASIQNLLDDIIYKLDDTGDFTVKQLKSVQAYWVKDMTNEIKEVASSGPEQNEMDDEPYQEEESKSQNELPAGLTENEVYKLKSLVFPEDEIKEEVTLEAMSTTTF